MTLISSFAFTYGIQGPVRQQSFSMFQPGDLDDNVAYSIAKDESRWHHVSIGLGLVFVMCSATWYKLTFKQVHILMETPCHIQQHAFCKGTE